MRAQSLIWLAHGHENRIRFSQNTTCRFNVLEHTSRLRVDARRSRLSGRRNAGHAAGEVALSGHDALVLPGSLKLKTAAEDFSVVPPFEIRSGAEQRVPFVFNSPHSGRYYPDRFLAMARLDRNAIRRSEDCYVDELFGGAVALGAPMLAANFPRAYLDVNREPWELDPRMFAEPVPSFCNIRSARVAGGLGTVPKLVGEGLEIYSGRLPLAEAVARIEAVYKPYHETLKRLLTRTHARFGFAVLIDCHSMPASIRVGDNGLRPDFIVGDRFGISCLGGADRDGDRPAHRHGLYRRPQQALCRRLHHRALRPAGAPSPCAADRGQSRALHERADVPEIRRLRCAGRRSDAFSAPI